MVYPGRTNEKLVQSNYTGELCVCDIILFPTRCSVHANANGSNTSLPLYGIR